MYMPDKIAIQKVYICHFKRNISVLVMDKIGNVLCVGNAAGPAIAICTQYQNSIFQLRVY